MQTMDNPSAAAHDTEGERRRRTPEEIVRQLQARIVKAQNAGRYNKVKTLQYLLTRSQSARQLAVERVTTNDGKKTPGGGRGDLTDPAEESKGGRNTPAKGVQTPTAQAYLYPQGKWQEMARPGYSHHGG
jgi:RNA-directed DNA polymerase